MAIYDCFQYFNEDHVLDLRFNILNEKVDYFVISESTKTHQGAEKKLNFNLNNFNKFKHKIKYISKYNAGSSDQCIFKFNNDEMDIVPYKLIIFLDTKQYSYSCIEDLNGI